MIARPHPLAESERPSMVRTVVTVAAPFVVLAAVIAILVLTN